MAARSIKEGDRVRIFVNGDSWMTAITGGIEGTWMVNWTPSDVGELWTFEHDGQVIEISPCSANFDGLELVEKAMT